MTLTAGTAAVHQSILGDRMRLPLDADAVRTRSPGRPPPLAHPALVCDVAIGQSTLATQRVKANLFYRGLTFSPVPGHRRHPVHPHRSGWAEAELGQAGPRADRAGGAADDDHRPGRPAGARLLPVRDAAVEPDGAPRPVTPTTCPRSAPTPLRPPRPDRRLGRRGVPRPGARPALRRRRWRARVLHSTADVVSSAPELARLTSEHRCHAS